MRPRGEIDAPLDPDDSADGLGDARFRRMRRRPSGLELRQHHGDKHPDAHDEFGRLKPTKFTTKEPPVGAALFVWALAAE
jgi:hypothetical protein